MSRKRFTHFVRKVFGRQSLPTGKLRLFRALGVCASLWYPLSAALHASLIQRECKTILKMLYVFWHIIWHMAKPIVHFAKTYDGFNTLAHQCIISATWPMITMTRTHPKTNTKTMTKIKKGQIFHEECVPVNSIAVSVFVLEAETSRFANNWVLNS